LKELWLRSYVAPYNVAITYAGLGDKDLNFAVLEKAFPDKAYYLPVYLTTDARLDYLHSDAHFIHQPPAAHRASCAYSPWNSSSQRRQTKGSSDASD
jgi:hypothetical protein